MKRIILVLCMLMASVCYADQSQKFYIDHEYEMHTDGSDATLSGYILDASSSETFTKDFDTMKPVGFASLQIEIAGSGTLKITHESSNDGVGYNTAIVNGSAADDIVTALTSGSELYQFDLPFAQYFRLKLEETSGANSITVTKATLAVQ